MSDQVSPYYKFGQDTVLRRMNVYSVDNVAKTFTVIFGGAYSGTYDLKISHKKYGLVDTKGMILTVGSEVTSFGPNSGSIYGGTLITLHGTNWDP